VVAPALPPVTFTNASLDGDGSDSACCLLLTYRDNDATEQVVGRLPNSRIVVTAGRDGDGEIEIRDHKESLAAVAKNGAPWSCFRRH
jgi:hypothetical protein